MKKLYYLIILLAVCIFVPNLYAQSAAPVEKKSVSIVIGKITHKDGSPAVKVSVAIGDKFSYTDIRGNYRIKNVPFGRHNIQIKSKDKILKEEEIHIDKPRIKYNGVISTQ